MKTKTQGFSFVELLISMFVLSIGMLGIIGGFYYTQKSTDRTVSQYSAFKTGEHYLMEVKEHPLTDEIVASGQITITTPTGGTQVLKLGEWNPVDTIDIQGTSGNLGDDLEIQVMPVLARINDASGDRYSISLQYQWRETGSVNWNTDELQHVQATVSTYDKIKASPAALYTSSVTLETEQSQTITRQPPYEVVNMVMYWGGEWHSSNPSYPATQPVNTKAEMIEVAKNSSIGDLTTMDLSKADLSLFTYFIPDLMYKHGWYETKDIAEILGLESAMEYMQLQKAARDRFNANRTYTQTWTEQEKVSRDNL